MKAAVFYQQIVAASAQPPLERHIRLAQLHSEILNRYLTIIGSMSQQDAKRLGSDGRTLSQVVGHIAEWERFTILAAGEMIAGIKWPRIMSLSGFVEPDGRVQNFSSVDEFNAYQAVRQAELPWRQVQKLALYTAKALQTLFIELALLSPERLEETRVYKWRLPNGVSLAVPAGWYLWMVTLEHEAVEHASDLG